MKEMKCVIFRKVKDLGSDRVEWRQFVSSNQSQECILDDDDDDDDDDE